MGVVDVEEDGVEFFGGVGGVEIWGIGVGGGGLEEVGLVDGGSGVGGDLFSQGDEVLFVPVDDGLQVVDDDEFGDALVFEGGFCGVSEAETADGDVQFCVGEGGLGLGDADFGELFLYFGEEGGHEEFFVEDDFVDFEVVEGGHGSAAEDDLADGGLLVVDFLEAHLMEVVGGGFYHGRRGFLGFIFGADGVGDCLSGCLVVCGG